ncbi:hypothetical protein R3W88_033221 [Solanum pinnatisectum]|uniref:Uncharacterized protein n=1 Tax=Solanum pinnatisectum TaxID=50273 RepID=A0AAV9K1L4_9SOLN|nr:hypothetical protein R3W88_033221 [Solanum pinnatisectum]
MHQGGDEDTRIELTVNLKDKLETKDIEDGEIQSDDAMIIDAGVKSEVKMEMEPIIMRRVEEENKNQELAVVCLKSQHVQTLHEMMSHQGAAELQDRGNKKL